MDRLGYVFVDRDLILQALTHRSWVAENAGRESNERLEFLGDAVLGAVVAEKVYLDYPERPEGELAKIRSAVVSSVGLHAVARDIGVSGALFLGKGERSTGGAQKPSILADATESLIGAVFVEAGWARARELIVGLFGPMIVQAAEAPGHDDHKTTLQELVTRSTGAPPEYVVATDGPDHAKRFQASVVIDGAVIGSGAGSSKKEAEQNAAAAALDQLEDVALAADFEESNTSSRTR